MFLLRFQTYYKVCDLFFKSFSLGWKSGFERSDNPKLAFERSDKNGFWTHPSQAVFKEGISGSGIPQVFLKVSPFSKTFSLSKIGKIHAIPKSFIDPS